MEVSPRKEHGRHEERYTTVISDPKGLPAGWPDVAAVVLVGREREVKGKRTETAHYYITSHRGTAAKLLNFRLPGSCSRGGSIVRFRP